MSILSDKISPTLTTLLGELRDECLSTIKLIHQLELERLTEEQIEDVLGELTQALPSRFLLSLTSNPRKLKHPPSLRFTTFVFSTFICTCNVSSSSLSRF